MSNLDDCMDVANAADTADLWADPANSEIEATIDIASVIIDCINLTLDTVMSVLGYLDCKWNNTSW